MIKRLLCNSVLNQRLSSCIHMTASHTPTPTTSTHSLHSLSPYPHIQKQTYYSCISTDTNTSIYEKTLLYPHMLTQVISNFSTPASRVQFIVHRQRIGEHFRSAAYIHTYIHNSIITHIHTHALKHKINCKKYTTIDITGCQLLSNN